MRYLFLDIECSDGAHICEFGYVITDESFNIIDHSIMVINPESPFPLLSNHNGTELKLFYTEEQYLSSPTFPAFFKRIKELVEAPDQLVFGHAMINDAEFLRTATTRYSLEPICFEFLDTQRLFREFVNTTDKVSLEHLEEALCLEPVQYHHRSDEDALLTMRLLRAICERSGKTVKELEAENLTARGYSREWKIGYYGGSLEESYELIDKHLELVPVKRRRRIFSSYIDRLEERDGNPGHPLYSKIVCFSPDIEQDRIRDAIVLIDKIYELGGGYDNNTFTVNIYIATEEELAAKRLDDHPRYASIIKARRKGRRLTIMTIRDLLSLLSITERELAELPLPPFPEKKKKNKSASLAYSCGAASGTVGDMMRAKGIDLLAMFGEK